MYSFEAQSNIIITCSKRLAPFLAKEVGELGFTIEKVFPTGVELKGNLNDCIRLNLHLRCASQVLYSVTSFFCDHPKELYAKVTEVQWEDIIGKNGYFSITSTVNDPSVNNSLFANVTVKDAIADRFRNLFGLRPDSGASMDAVVIHLFWRNERAEIFIDTSGHTLSKHGYRRIPGKAPMLESLAAATLLALSWDREVSFVNPMCGSGTVAIEAALLATNRYPGLLRDNYGFRHILGFDEEYFINEKDKLSKQIVEKPGLKIYASDLSEDAINISRINAAAAGVDTLIEFRVCDFFEADVPEMENGIVFLNPEYGDRMGNEIELEATYHRIGDFLKQKCKGYMGYIFTGNLDLAKKIGLKAKRKIEFYNSKIDCRLLEYELYAGTKRIVKHEEKED